MRVLLGIYSFRLNRRISEPGMPGDMLVDVDHSGTGRESCNVSTIAITCEPRDWRKAVEVGASPPSASASQPGLLKKCPAATNEWARAVIRHAGPEPSQQSSCCCKWLSACLNVHCWPRWRQS